MLASVVVIRVDSSFSMGVGHLMRCLTLAENLSQHNVNIHFICRQHPGNLMGLLQKKNYQVHILASSETTKNVRGLGVSVQQDAAETKAILEKFPNVECLIVDHYDLDMSWEKEMRSKVSSIMVIDDLANRKHDCDMLLDQTFSREENDYKNLVPDHCRLLLGSDYALIPLHFLGVRAEALKKRALNSKVRTVLVSMGGTDPDNVTQFVIDAIQQSKIEVNVDVILGPRALHRDSIKAITNLHQSSNVQIYDNVTNMAEMMLNADLAIGAGGTTSWERCCLGLPTLLITTAENQIKIAKELDRIGAVKYIGQSDKINQTVLVDTLESFLDQTDLIREMSQASEKICDGYGAGRVVAELLSENASDGSSVHLKRASMEDAEIMLSWQEHPSTRRYSRNPTPPTRSEHYSWLEKRLSDIDCIFNIVYYAKSPAGVLRLDRIPDKENTYEISILISSDYRRLGLAKSALKLARTVFPNFEFHAEVLPGNRESHSLFIKAGFNLQDNVYIDKPKGGL